MSGDMGPTDMDLGTPEERLTGAAQEIRTMVAHVATALEALPDQGVASAVADSRTISRAIGSMQHLLASCAPSGADPAVRALELREMRRWAETWSGIEALLTVQLPPVARPLYPAFRDQLDPRRAQSAMADAAAGLQHRLLNPSTQDATTMALGAFSDISLPQSTFFAHLHAAGRVLMAQGRSAPSRFLDVGCGSGEKVLAAAPWVGQASGLELDPGYAALGRNLMQRAPNGNVDVIEADALEFDGYDAFDVIYFFRPMRHPEKLAQLERRVVDGARPGTLLIAPYKAFAHCADALGCARIDGQLYLAHGSRAEADELRRVAEFTGPALAASPGDWPDIWKPILTASLARGFVP